jgi:alpha-1,4-digalacturonate transport system substrate-binding protein
MPGGAALVGLESTQHPEEVARVIDYLAGEEVLSEFYARTLFIPGHVGLAEAGVDYQTDSELTTDALTTFSGEVAKLSPIAYELQGYPYNRVVFDTVRDRLTQVFAGELSLDEAITRMQSDIDDGIAEAERGE